MKAIHREQTYDRWLREHRGIFFKVLRAYAFTREDQEDLFQEMALQVWKSVPAFRQESSEVTWLYRIALNTALKWTRKAPPRDTAATSSASLLQVADRYENEQLNWLYDQIARLPKVDRSLMLLLLDGFSYREIAGISGLTENHVGVKIHRIKQQLAAAAKTTAHEGL